MQFKEEKVIYYLSPFKIINIERIYGKGFPYCDSFHYV
jgi:hypothetical protein